MTDTPTAQEAVEGVAILMDHVNASLEYASAIQTTPFEQLTPEVWEAVQQGAGGLMELLGMVRMAFSASMAVVDDEELFKRSQEVMAPFFQQ